MHFQMNNFLQKEDIRLFLILLFVSFFKNIDIIEIIEMIKVIPLKIVIG